MVYALKSDRGLMRSENQDSCGAFEKDGALFLLLADGMGGANGGSIASNMACIGAREMIENEYRADMSDAQLISLLQSCFVSANSDIFRRALREKELAGMGTTLVIAAVRNESCHILSVGDSRAYIINTSIRQITKDQSYVQYLIDKGEISADEAKNHPKKNVIMQAVGTSDSVFPEAYSEIFKDSALLLCSDGLTNKLTDNEIEKIFCKKTALAKKAEELINSANDAGGEDNISVVIAAERDFWIRAFDLEKG